MAIPTAIPTKILLEIVTPDRALVREEADELQLPGSEGYLGVLPGHTPLLTSLKVGELWYRVGAEKHYFAIAGGFVEILPDRVVVLAQIAESAHEIDIARAEAAMRRAEESHQNRPPGEQRPVELALRRSQVRLKVAQRRRARRPGMGLHDDA